MACKRPNPSSDQDPDYENITVHQAKRIKLFEKDAKEATVQKITNIIKTQFAQAIAEKQFELEIVDQRLHQASVMLDRLRSYVIASYYSAGEKSSTGERINNQQFFTHPAVKSTFMGKAPRNFPSQGVFNVPETTTSLSSATTSQQLSSQISQASSTSSSWSSSIINSTAKTVPPSPDSNRLSRFKTKKRIIVGNVSRYIPLDKREESDQSTHRWMVYVRGPKDEPRIDHFVKKVWFFLHPSYRPNDLVEVNQPPFHLTRRGWGEFPVRVQLHFHDPRNKRLDIIHMLKLDKTYTGLQTLGAETNADIWIYKQEEEGTKSTSNNRLVLKFPSTIDGDTNPLIPALCSDELNTHLTPSVSGYGSESTSVESELGQLMEEGDNALGNSLDDAHLNHLQQQEESDVDSFLSSRPCSTSNSDIVLSFGDTQVTLDEDTLGSVTTCVTSDDTSSVALNVSANVTIDASTVMTGVTTTVTPKISTTVTPKVSETVTQCSSGATSTVSTQNLINIRPSISTVASTVPNLSIVRTVSSTVMSNLSTSSYVKPTFVSPKLVNVSSKVDSETRVTTIVSPQGSSLLVSSKVNAGSSNESPAILGSGTSLLQQKSLLKSNNKATHVMSDLTRTAATTFTKPLLIVPTLPSHKGVPTSPSTSLLSPSRQTAPSILVIPTSSSNPIGPNSPTQIKAPQLKQSQKPVSLIRPPTVASGISTITSVVNPSVAVSSTTSTASTGNNFYIKCKDKQGNIFLVPVVSSGIRTGSSPTTAGSSAMIRPRLAAQQPAQNSGSQLLLSSPGSSNSSSSASTGVVPGSVPTYILIPSKQGANTQAQLVRVAPQSVSTSTANQLPSVTTLPTHVPRLMKSFKSLKVKKETTSVEENATVTTATENLVNIDQLSSVETIYMTLAKQFPLVSENPDRHRHPYCAPSAEVFFSWFIGKQRAAEFSRAKAIQRAVAKALSSSVKWKDGVVWKAKDLLYWCRKHGFTPLKPVLSEEDGSENSSEATSNVNTYSEATDLFSQLQILEDEVDRTCHPDNKQEDVEVDVIGVDDDLTSSRKKSSDARSVSSNALLKTTTTTGNSVLYVPKSEEAEFVNEECSRIGIKMAPVEVFPGVMASVSEEMISAVSKVFMENILRYSLAQGFERVGNNRCPETITLDDVIRCLQTTENFDFLTNKYLGKKIVTKVEPKDD